MDLAHYLPRTARRTGPGQEGGASSTAWSPVIRRLAEEPDSPASANLAAALSTPLMVALARAVYSDRPGHDPQALLDTETLPTAGTIEDHLLASFVPAVYRHRPPQSGAARAGRHRNWDPDRARNWLGCLAWHLDAAGGDGSRDLAWWQLGSMLRPSARILAVTLAATLATAVADWLVITPLSMIQYGAAFGLRAGLADGLATGLPVGVAFGLIYACMAAANRLACEPSRMRLRLPGQRNGVRAARGRRYARWGGAGFLGGLVVGIGFGPARTLEAQLLFGTRTGAAPLIQATLVNTLCFGIIFAVAGGIGLGLMTMLETPLDTGAAATPASLLVMNRRTVLRQVLVMAPLLAVVIGVAGWVVVALLQGLAGPLSWPLSGGIVVGVVGGASTALCYALAFTAWGQWIVLSRVMLPLTGRLPWALLQFLDDAYQRGVVRQAGAVYQFRHVRLQRHLGQAHLASRAAR